VGDFLVENHCFSLKTNPLQGTARMAWGCQICNSGEGIFQNSPVLSCLRSRIITPIAPTARLEQAVLA
jgi:hypothetical protein